MTDTEGMAFKRMLKRLTEKVERANAIQHSGVPIEPEDWAELYQLTNEAKAVLEATPIEDVQAAIERNLEATVVAKAKCPNCGAVDSISHKRDAWEVEEVLGFDADGKLITSAYKDTQTCDDTHFGCEDCGEIIEEKAIQQAEPGEGD